MPIIATILGGHFLQAFAAARETLFSMVLFFIPVTETQEMNAAAIRNVLRLEEGDHDLDRRRKVIALSALGLLDFTFISLYQTGILKRLPDIPLPVFDSNKVNASTEAYQFGVPDGPVSATVYGLTMMLAAAGGNERTGRKPLVDVLLGGAVAGNLGGALYYLYDMAFNQKKICLYCVAGAVINIASAVVIAPVVSRALKKVTSPQASS